MNQPSHNFLYNQAISQNMIRGLYGEFGQTQQYEENFLKYCLKPENRKLIEQFIDKDKNLLIKSSEKFNCSTNSLGQLFYFAKILENSASKKITKLIEIGGGFGSFANIIKQFFPDCTIIIFDLPECIALQYLFLNYTNENIKIKIHKNENSINNLEENCIHLIPIYFLHAFKSVNIDVFISNFGLTETPEFVQNLTIEKKFFEAKLIYITGQLNGWNESNINWIPNHNNLINNLRKQYKYSNCSPLHDFNNKEKSYEMICYN